PAPQSQPEVSLTTPLDRRADIDAKHLRIATLLQEIKCEGLLLLEPENVAWLTSGGSARGTLDRDEMPVLYFSPEGRWLLASNVEAEQRLCIYRHCGFTATPIRTYAVLSCAARKYGLFATASRSVCFGQPDALVKKDHEAACKVSATYVSASWPDAVPKQIL